MSLWLEPATCIPGVMIDMGDLLRSIAPSIRPPRRDNRQIVSLSVKRDILDQLDDYFFYIDRVKKLDSDAYNLFRQTGGSIHGLGRENGFFIDKLTGGWRDGKRPAFGMVCNAFRENDGEEEYVSPQLCYFMKMNDKFVEVEPHTGDLYQLTLYYDKKSMETLFKNNGGILSFYVSVHQDGTVAPLRYKQNIHNRFYSRKGKKWISVTQREYGYNEAMMSVANKNNHGDLIECCREIFIWCANSWWNADGDGWRVNVERGNISASFRISPNVGPSLFSDRNLYVNENGRRKKIFHHVLGHNRVTSAGEIVSVRPHYRGQRDFRWKAYSIHISVDGVHHSSLNDFDAEAIDVDQIDFPVWAATMEQTGLLLKTEIMR